MAKGKKTGGRKPGSKNKLTVSVKDTLHQAFEELGGVPFLIAWGKKNQTEFCKLWGRLIPQEIANGENPIRIDVTSGGKSIEQRDTIRAEAIAEAMRLVGLARPDISRDGAPEPLDTARSTLEARGIPSTNGYH